MAAATSSSPLSEELLGAYWKMIPAAFLLSAVTILHRTLSRTQSPLADLRSALAAAWALLEGARTPRSERQGRLAGLSAEHREKSWAAFACLMVGSPVAAVQPIIVASICFFVGCYRPLDLIKACTVTIGCVFLGTLVLAEMNGVESHRLVHRSLFLFGYIGFAVLLALAPTLQVYAFSLPLSVISHSCLVQLAPDPKLLAVLEAFHFGLGLWTVWSSPFMEGYRIPQSGVCFGASFYNLLQYFVRENSAMELVKSMLSAREAEATANELLVMMTDAVVGLDHNLALLQDSQKLAAILSQPSVEAGTLLQQLLVPSEEERVLDFVKSESAAARQLLTDFQDSIGRRVPVRMYHVRLNDAITDLPLHLLGLVEEGSAREPVADSVAPLADFSRQRREAARLSSVQVGRLARRGSKSSSSGSGRTASSVAAALGLVNVGGALMPASAVADSVSDVADILYQRRQGQAGSSAHSSQSSRSGSRSHSTGSSGSYRQDANSDHSMLSQDGLDTAEGSRSPTFAAASPRTSVMGERQPLGSLLRRFAAPGLDDSERRMVLD